MRRGVPPRAVKQGPAPTPSLPPSATPSPSSSPTSGRGSASLSTPGSRPPASPQRGSGNGKYVTPSARRSGSSNEDEYSLARDENYQKKIFEGKDQVQTRRPNPNRFSHNQISSINSLLTSGYQKTPIASQKSIDNSGGNTPMNGSEKTTVASQKMSTDDAAPNRNSEKTPAGQEGTYPRQLSRT